MRALAWDKSKAMADFDINILRRNLAAIMARKDVKPTTLSLRIGKSPTLVKDLLEKTGDTKVSTIFRLADELGVSVDDLLIEGADLRPVPIGPQLYVKGVVAAGLWQPALEQPREEWQAFTGRSDVTAKAEHRFGLRIVGNSMDEIYPPGTIIECVSVFGHAEPEPGKRVVVIRENEQGEVEATVKELVETGGTLWAVPRSKDPSFRPINLTEPEEGIVEIRIAAVVVASVRPE